MSFTEVFIPETGVFEAKLLSVNYFPEVPVLGRSRSMTASAVARDEA